MRWVLEPIARKAGIREKRAIVRFTEQGYSFCYYSKLRSLLLCCSVADSSTPKAVFWFIGLVRSESRPPTELLLTLVASNTVHHADERLQEL